MISELKFNNIEDICKKIVKPTGASGHVYLPKKWINKEVIVLLVDDNND